MMIQHAASQMVDLGVMAVFRRVYNEIMRDLKINWLHLLIIGAMLVVIPISIYLVKHQQIFKSRANLDISSSLDVGGNQEVTCSGNTCTTQSNTVTIQLKDNPNTLFNN